MEKLFGTDGIRGTTSNKRKTRLRLTPKLVLRIGQAIGELASNRPINGTTDLVILGRDTRNSGAMIESALTAGLLAQGVDVVQVGVAPTPAIAFLVKQFSARFGIIISASHNLVDDNGIKVFGPDGYKLSDEAEEFVQARVLSSHQFLLRDTRELGRLRSSHDLQQLYINYLVQSWQGKSDLSGKLVLLECANGATSFIAPEVFCRLGARVEAVNDEPDGLNINESYEYIEPKQFRELVLAAGADVGVAFDGDGDRVILIDEQGQIIDGDTIMAILARDMLARNKLPSHAVVTTNMSNFGLHNSLREVGVEVVETQVGDRFVLAEMLANGHKLGGERSGHILILDGEQTTGDGIYTALAVMTVMVNQPGCQLSKLASIMPRYPQFIESVDIPAKPPLERISEVQGILEQLRKELGKADVNLRYSGTESKVRLSVRSRRDDCSNEISKRARMALHQIARIISALE